MCAMRTTVLQASAKLQSSQIVYYVSSYWLGIKIAQRSAQNLYNLENKFDKETNLIWILCMVELRWTVWLYYCVCEMDCMTSKTVWKINFSPGFFHVMKDEESWTGHRTPEHIPSRIFRWLADWPHIEYYDRIGTICMGFCDYADNG